MYQNCINYPLKCYVWIIVVILVILVKIHVTRRETRNEMKNVEIYMKHVVKMQSKDNLKKVFALPRQKKLFDRRSFHYQVLAKSESVKESNETQGI